MIRLVIYLGYAHLRAYLRKKLFISDYLTIHHFQFEYILNKEVSPMGPLNNYVDKNRGEGVSRKPTLSQVTKGRYHVKCL